MSGTPPLHDIYASELFTIIKGHLPNVYCFPDDSQLYLSCSPNGEQGEVEAVKNMELCVNDIRNWMSKDKLLMNDRKTQCLIIGDRQQLQKVNIKGISVGAQDISPADSAVKNLGVWLDKNLSMVAHITRTCSAAFYYLYTRNTLHAETPRRFKLSHLVFFRLCTRLISSPVCSSTLS